MVLIMFGELTPSWFLDYFVHYLHVLLWIIVYEKIPIRNVTYTGYTNVIYTKCYLCKMLPRQSVLYEMLLFIWFAIDHFIYYAILENLFNNVFFSLFILTCLSAAEAIFFGPIAVGVASGILSLFGGRRYGASVARSRSHGHHTYHSYQPSHHYDHQYSSYYTRPNPVNYRLISF